MFSKSLNFSGNVFKKPLKDCHYWKRTSISLQMFLKSLEFFEKTSNHFKKASISLKMSSKRIEIFKKPQITLKKPQFL
jgi:hypothetical protein